MNFIKYAFLCNIFCQWLCQVLLGLVPKSQNWKIFFLVKKDIAMSWDKACLAIIHREKKQTNIIRVVFVQSHGFGPIKQVGWSCGSHIHLMIYTPKCLNSMLPSTFYALIKELCMLLQYWFFFFFFFLIPNKTSLMMENFC